MNSDESLAQTYLHASFKDIVRKAKEKMKSFANSHMGVFEEEAKNGATVDLLSGKILMNMQHLQCLQFFLFSGFFISVIYFRFPGIRNILIYLLFRFPEEIFRYIYGIPVSRNKTNIYFGAFRFPGISKYIYLEHSGFSAVTGPYRSRF